MALNSIEELVEDIRQGKMVILMDDEDRENEGDLIMAAECCKAEDINFMVKHARGLVCMPMSRERCELLKLPLMSPRNGSGFGTKFTVSIEATTGVTTGISAADRARTIAVAIDLDSTGDDLVSPGHVFPLIAAAGGVAERPAALEAAIELCKRAGAGDAAVICSIMREDGEMARIEDLAELIAQHSLCVADVGDVLTA